MSSSTHRINKVMNLIRAYKDDPDADEIIRMKTGYSKALISAIRSDMEKYDTTRMNHEGTRIHSEENTISKKKTSELKI